MKKYIKLLFISALIILSHSNVKALNFNEMLFSPNIGMVPGYSIFDNGSVLISVEPYNNQDKVYGYVDILTPEKFNELKNNEDGTFYDKLPFDDEKFYEASFISKNSANRGEYKLDYSEEIYGSADYILLWAKVVNSNNDKTYNYFILDVKNNTLISTFANDLFAPGVLIYESPEKSDEPTEDSTLKDEKSESKEEKKEEPANPKAGIEKPYLILSVCALISITIIYFLKYKNKFKKM